MKDFLSKLRSEQIHLELVAGELSVNFPRGQANEELLGEIRLRKSEIIRYLTDLTLFGYEGIPKIGEAVDYPLSSSQRRLWLLSQLEEGNIAYNIPEVFVIEGEPDVQGLTHSFAKLIERHEILRTVFTKNATGEVRQTVRPVGEWQFSILCHDLQESEETALSQTLKLDLNMPFDLANGPLLRANLYQLREGRYIFSLVMHHIISDVWSLQVATKELFQYYEQYLQGKNEELTPLRVQFKDFAYYEQQQLLADAMHRSRDYWLDQFAGEIPVLELTRDKVRPLFKTYAGIVLTRQLSPAVSKGLKRICETTQSTLFMVLLAGLKALLYRYTEQEDIIVGTPVAGRDHVELENQIGFYINTLALRTRFNGDDPFEKLVKKVREVTLNGYQHQAYPFDQLVEDLDLTRDMSRHPLFDIMIVMQNVHGEGLLEGGQIGGMKVAKFEGLEEQSSKFDLSFTFAEQTDGIFMQLNCSTDLYTPETAERIGGHLQRVLEIVAVNPSVPVREIEFLSPQEHRQLTKVFNNNEVAYPAGANLVSLFREEVVKYPDKTALICEDEKMSYRELDERSDALAAYLVNHYGIKREELIGVMADRSIAMLVGLLGILKSGAAYVPIDPGYPRSRKSFIAKDTGFKVLLTQSDYLFELDYYDGEVFALDLQLTDLQVDPDWEAEEITQDQLAFVLYTSGSTGRPKGVLSEHRNPIRLVKQPNYVRLSEHERILSLANFVFDAFTFDLYGALLNGATMIISDRNLFLDSKELDLLIEREGVTTFFVTTSLFNALAENRDLKFRGVRQVLFGGEEASVAHVREFRERYPGIDLINVYGPTENTTFSTTHTVGEVSAGQRSISIGPPVTNTMVYILNENCSKLCPIGVVGEICVGGSGLARGYLNRPELTAEKFVEDPFRPGERIYKTGDLGRWQPDGTVAFISRIDDQVKIRGYRIELGEISYALEEHPAVERAVVVIRQNLVNEKELVAYLKVAEGEENLDYKGYLKGKLPSYMVPTHFVVMDELPLNENGKIARKALPSPEELSIVGVTDYEAPQTDLEVRLTEIWSEILGVERDKISSKANFFDLGGHSLKAARLANLIRKTFEVEIALKDLFVHVELSSQAAFIEKAVGLRFNPIGVLDNQADYMLSASQRRLWILSRFEASNSAYNMAGVYTLEGAVDVAALSFSVQQLISRHEILRTIFVKNETDEVRQRILSPEELDSPYVKLISETLARRP